MEGIQHTCYGEGSWYVRLVISSQQTKVVLPLIIGPCQGAFVHGRQILDDILIANESVDSRKRTKKWGVIFKIDMEKAFDCVVVVVFFILGLCA